MSQGVYKITNIINNHSYIGVSKNIENRWKTHITRAFNYTDKEFNKVLYKAFRKYGVENFVFEIIEYIDGDNYDAVIAEREQY